MALLRNSGKDFERAPAGKHNAVLIRFIDLGEQVRKKYNSDETEFKRMVYLVYELVDAKMSDGRPFIQYERMNYNCYKGEGLKARLPERIEMIMDTVYSQQELDEFDVMRLLGKNCVVYLSQTTEGNKKFVNVERVLPREGYTKQTENEQFVFNMVDGLQNFEKLSESLQEKIMASDAYLEAVNKEQSERKQSSPRPARTVTAAHRSTVDDRILEELNDEVPF